MRFRIVELLLVVAVFAFATVSLKRADPLFEMLFFNFTLVVIIISLIMAIGRTKGARAFWTGFFAASSLYLGFSLVPDSYQYSPRYDGPEFTTQLLRLAGEQLHPNAFDSELPYDGGFFSVQDEPDPFGDLTTAMENAVAGLQGAEETEKFEPNLTLIYGSGQKLVLLEDPLVFMRIGHAAWALLFGWIGGHLSRFVYERSRPGVG